MSPFKLFYWKNRRRVEVASLSLGLLLCIGLLTIVGGLAQLLPAAPFIGLVVRGTRYWSDKFDRAQTYTTTPGVNGWTIADTSAAGTPTYLNATEDGGSAVLTLANTSEAENVCLYQNDVLMFDLRQVQRFRAIAKVSGVDAVTTIVIGLGSARNDTPDSVAYNAWFRIEGSASTSNVVVETDDATVDNDDKATGTTLGSTYKLLEIDFTNGLSDVRFFIDGERVASGTTFDMSAAAAGQNVQPIIQVQKASGTGTPAVTLALVEIDYMYALGA